jgi:hypothetical protein
MKKKKISKKSDQTMQVFLSNLWLRSEIKLELSYTEILDTLLENDAWYHACKRERSGYSNLAAYALFCVDEVPCMCLISGCAN